MADRLECTHCRVPLRPDQDWCVECGAAQPGRLGRRPGWRAALTVVGATLALAGGATAASYAALTSDAVVEAGAPAPPGADPVIAQAPAVPQPPAETLPAPRVEVPDVTAPAPADAPLDPIDPVTPTTPDTDTDTRTDGGTIAGGGTGGDTGGDTDTDTETDADAGTGDDAAGTDDTGDDEPAEVALAGARLRTYDPGDRGGTRLRPATRAADGRASTAWEAPADADGVVGIGLVITLDRATELRALELDALTPGFNVQVFGTKGPALPADVVDPAWEQTDETNDVGTTERLRLSGRYRHVLVWITEQPADTEAAISEVRLFADG